MKRMNVLIAVLALTVFTSSRNYAQDAGAMGQMHREMHPGRPAGPLKISFGEKSAEWTPEKLAALPHITVTVFNQHAKANQSYAGVPLFDLLKSLGFPENPHGRDLRLYILAAGS